MKKLFILPFALINLQFSFATSLWPNQGAGLVGEYKPIFRIGDIILVTIKEEAKAVNNSKTEVKDQSTSNSDVLGKMTNVLQTATTMGLPGKILKTAAANLENTKGQSTMTGEGKMTENSSLESTVSVMVKAILSNGNLHIEGTKSVLVNKEKQDYRLTGVVRPEDVLANKIESSKIADAKIELVGKGAFDGTRKPGPVTRFFNNIF